MNRKVKFVRFHSTVMHLPSVGELGTSFPPTGKSLDNLSMTMLDAGLVVSFSFKGLKKEVFVPSSNIVLADLVPESNE